jgi:hypothetical protein
MTTTLEKSHTTGAPRPEIDLQSCPSRLPPPHGVSFDVDTDSTQAKPIFHVQHQVQHLSCIGLSALGDRQLSWTACKSPKPNLVCKLQLGQMMQEVATSK